MYTFDSVIRYSETAPDERLSLPGIVDYFQDCSTFQSESLHVGVDELGEAHKGWVLSYWQIVIRRRPKLLEKVTTGTWAYKFDKFFGYRNFVFQTPEKEMLACANSVWVFIDTGTGRPVRPDGNFGNAYAIEPAYDGMTYEGRKMSRPEQMDAEEPFLVRKSNLDTFRHVNNGQYIQMALEYLPDNFEVAQIRAEYKLSAVYGDTIYPFVQTNMENERMTVDLRNAQGKTFAMIEFAREEQGR